MADAQSPDARFEVLGAPDPMLSVSLLASQNLYTRRGTLVGVSGKPENALSTLSVLKPVRRALLGIPFLYQKISSTTPLTLLIGTRSASSSFAVLRLDGTVDWIIAQRKALLAWTGHSLGVRPLLNARMSLAHWGNSEVTGRGLVALVCRGQVYEVTLRAGEEFVVHPTNVAAYTVTSSSPLPYRLRSNAIKLQIATTSNITSFLHGSKFIRALAGSDTWSFVKTIYFTLQTWSRRTIWGDRLFLHFHGPATLLLQSRASHLRDVLSDRDVNETAQTEPGHAPLPALLLPSSSVRRSTKEKASDADASGSAPADDRRHLPAATPEAAEAAEAAAEAVRGPPQMRFATVGRDGTVAFEKTDSFLSKSLTRS
ncbi:MAG: Altered inheritance of mitochondria protein 24, mitochondrial [Phylliscum demangeonii]|nr:MAG: Altered inheritance of mitochondria protein 24, mitochondrial [Phylliscum demangeonii]